MKNKEADTELESRLLEILVHPCRIEDIRRELPNAGKNNLKNALDALVADGRVMKNKKNRFAVSAHYGCAAGTYLATERAFAFVAPDYPEGEAKPDDLFIPPNASGGAWHGDRVLVKVSERRNNRGRKEATVIRVLGRAGKELTGELVSKDECVGILSRYAFEKLYSRLLLWKTETQQQCSILQLIQHSNQEDKCALSCV